MMAAPGAGIVAMEWSAALLRGSRWALAGLARRVHWELCRGGDAGFRDDDVDGECLAGDTGVAAASRQPDRECAGRDLCIDRLLS